MTRKWSGDSPSRLVEIAEDGTEMEVPAGAASEYFDWLASSMSKYEELAKSLISHRGEKGRIVEGVVGGVLRTVLPQRYSIGSGFVITADGQSSSQIDLVVYDAFYNSPIIMGEGVGLFPIECVYATVEVKSVLTGEGVAQIARSIGDIRRFAETKRYVAYGKRETEPGKSTVEDRMLADVLPPRAYAVALRSGLSDIATLEETLIAATTEHHAHIHGLAVIQQDWFFKQHAYTTPHEFHVMKGRALAAFSSSALRGIQSFNMMPAAMDRYLGQSDDEELPRDSNGRLEEYHD